MYIESSQYKYRIFSTNEYSKHNTYCSVITLCLLWFFGVRLGRACTVCAFFYSRLGYRKGYQRRYKYDEVEVITSRDKACGEVIDIYLFSQEIRQALKENAASSTLTSLSAQFLLKMTSLQAYLEFFTGDSDDLREPCPLPGYEYQVNNASCSKDNSAPGCLHCVTHKIIPSTSDLDSRCLWLLRDFQKTREYLRSMNTSFTNQGSTTNATSAPTELLSEKTSTANTSATGSSLTSTELQSSLKVTGAGGSVTSATAPQSTRWVPIVTEGSTSVISEDSNSSRTEGLLSTLKEESPSSPMTNSSLSSSQPVSTPQSTRFISILNCTSIMVLPENEATVQLLEFSKTFEHDLLVLEEGQVFLPEMQNLLRFLQTMWEPLPGKKRKIRNKVKRYVMNFRSDQLQLSESVKCSLKKYDDPKYLLNPLEEWSLRWGEKLTDIDRLFYVACYLAKFTSATNDETIEKGIWERSRDASLGWQIAAILDSVSTYEGKIDSLQVRTEEARFNVTEALKNRSLVVQACV
ncbi:uncharacterized protein [Palaemon carinicauda]|uniref:uncharacterized protein n=1 Tax=Palaemon carinicauda TaxID=392227 RepID=UPI0035B65D7D